MKILEQWPTSSVAAHGIRLLTSMLQECTKKFDVPRPESRTQDPAFPNNIAPQALADAASEITTTEASSTENTLASEPWPNPDFDVDMLGFEDLMDGLPMQAGIDNNVFFSAILLTTQLPRCPPSLCFVLPLAAQPPSSAPPPVPPSSP